MTIETWSDLFLYIGKGKPLMHVLRCPKQTADAMRRRVIIPPKHWNRLVAWAAENGKPEITYDLLARLAANHPPRIAAE